MKSEEFLGYGIDYVFTEAYGVNDLSLESLQELVLRLEKGKKEMDFYYAHYRTKVDPIFCDEQCKRGLFCELAFVDPLLRENCLLSRY